MAKRTVQAAAPRMNAPAPAPAPAKEEDPMRVLFPGKKIPLGETGLSITIYPLGFTHLQRFTEKVSGMLMLMMNLQVTVPEGANKAQIEEAVKKKVMAQLLPMILENGLDLFKACVVMPSNLELDNLPHWELPPLIEAWIEESFGEERKWRPWVATVERLVEKFTGKKQNLKELLSPSADPSRS